MATSAGPKSIPRNDQDEIYCDHEGCRHNTPILNQSSPGFNTGTGSMIVYLASREDAVKLLRQGMMDIEGENSFIRPFERRPGPERCFKCHQFNHIAPRCPSREVVYGKRAQSGHGAKDCTSERVECAVCCGPHTTYDNSCRYTVSRRRNTLFDMIKRLHILQEAEENARDTNEPAERRRFKRLQTSLITEPYFCRIDGKPVVVPQTHHYWTAILPSQQRETRWPFRSMTWVHRNIEAKQVPVAR